MKLYIFILLITLAVFTVGGGFLFGVFEIEHQHEYGEWQTRTPATCTEDGVEFRVCECEAEETRAIVSLGHSYATTVTEPTCTEGGYTTYSCTCGHSYVGDETNATGHSHTPVVTEPTCTEGGYTTYTCKCGDKQVGLETEALGHDFTNEVAEEKHLATNNCGEKATYYKSCHCGEAGEETFEYGNVLAHQYETVVTEPTCTEGGYTTYTCNCGHSYVSDETNSTGHSYEAVVTEPTCENGGFTTHTCKCGDSYVDNYTEAKGHSTVAKSDDTHHWTECANGCGQATEKVAHSAVSISAVYNKDSAMEHDVISASDLTVTATCECGKTYTVTEGITLENSTLAFGENTVTVSFGGQTTEVILNAVKFNKVINGSVVADTYVYGAKESQGNNYNSYADLSTNGDNFRVLLKYNFSALLNSEYYALYKDEAKVQFSFTMTKGSIDNDTKITFKVYPVSELRSGADFSALTWKNYNENYQLGWGMADGFVNKTTGHPAVSIDGDKVTITVAYRDFENYIDADGNAIFVLAFWKSETKIASSENTNEAIRPAVSITLNDEHLHSYFHMVAEEQFLASAECGKKATYYRSCSCGAIGTETFEGDEVKHSYGQWIETQAPTCTVEGINSKTCDKCGDVQTEPIPVIDHSYNAVVTNPTCTEAGYTTYTCACGASYTDNTVAATGHSYGEWLFDESYHWQACACGDIAGKDTHKGGEATETEQAICDTCKQPYGGLASHVHNHNASVTAPTCTKAGYTTYTCACGDVYTGNEVAATGHTYGEWETAHPATCEGDEVLVHSCACGESETGVGTKAFGHDMQTQYDENNHWTKCAHNCGLSTDPVAHFGGEATESEKAVCEGCGQSYGELKPAEKQEYTINGTVKDDTFVYSSWTKTDLSEREYLRVYNSDSRTYFRYNFSDILGNADFVADKENAVVTFTFYFMTESFDYVNSSGQNKTMTVATPTDSSTVIFRGFNTNTSSIDTDFSSITWTSVNTGNEYNDIHYANGADIVNSTMNTENAKYENNVLTITVKYSDIEQYINFETGDALFVITTKTKSAFVYSIESEYKPTVSVTYTK